MFKILAILALFVFVFRVQAYAQPNKTQQAYEGDKPSPPIPLVLPKQTGSPELQTEHQEHVDADVRVVSTPPKDRWDKASVWINLGLAIVGLVGIGIAVCTLGKIEAGTQSVIRAERAWIVVSVDSIAPGEFRFWATNEGKTPAKVVSIWSCNIPLPRGETLTVPPDEQTKESLLQSPPCLIPPNAKRIIWQCKVTDFQKASGGGEGEQRLFSKGLVFGYIFGRIRYFDVLDVGATIAHETRWLYWLMPIKDAVPFPDPMHPEHNTYT